MKLRFVFKFGLALILWTLPQSVYADVTSDYVKLYRRSHSFTELALQLKPHLSAAEFDYLNQLAQKELKGAELPQVTQQADQTLIFTSGNLSVPVKIVSLPEKTLEVNHRLLRTADFTTPEEHFQAILKALPSQKTSQNWRLDLWLTPAHAQVGLILRAASWALSAIGAGALGLDLYGNNSYYCTEIKDAANNCKGPILKMMELARAFEKKQAAAKKKKVSPPLCPAKGDQEQQDKVIEIQTEAMTALDSINAKLGAGYTKTTIRCQEERDLASICQSTIHRLAKSLCFNVDVDLKALSRASKGISNSISNTNSKTESIPTAK